MLHDTQTAVIDDERPAVALAPAHRAAPAAGIVAMAERPTGGYGAQRRSWPPALILTVAIHAALFAILLTVREHVVHRREASLTVLNLAPPPPPPAAQDTPEPTETVETPVASPKPVIELPPRPIQTVAVVRDPLPQPVTLPAAAPATRTAPPAPPSIVEGADLSARMVAGKPPRYPVESRRKKEQGTVLLSLTLGVDGAVAAISVARSSGFERLDNAALDAVRKWRWEPMLRGGQPVMVKGVVEIPFVLKA